MDVKVEDQWAELIDRMVADGYYGSAADVVNEAMRQFEQQAAKLRGLRAMVQRSVADETEYTDEEVGAYLDEVAAGLDVRT